MRQKSKKWRLLALLACTVLFLFASGCFRTRKAEVVLIPKGYIGWARIEYGVSGAPPLHSAGSNYEIVLPKDNKFSTSSPMTSGLSDDAYFYVDQSGNKQSLRISDIDDSPTGEIRATRYITVPEMQDQKPRQFRVFFVGSASDYAKARKGEDFIPSL